MLRHVWEFLARGKDPVIETWLHRENISKRDRAKLDLALARLRTLDAGVFVPKLLAPIGDKVLKLRLRCENRELRPMLCRGPEPACDPLDYTLLAGAIEIGGDLDPSDAKEQAETNRATLTENPKWKRMF
jgi:hypothetical protein